MESETKMVNGLTIGNGNRNENGRWYRDWRWGWRQKGLMVQRFELGLEIEMVDGIEVGVGGRDGK